MIFRALLFLPPVSFYHTNATIQKKENKIYPVLVLIFTG